MTVPDLARLCSEQIVERICSAPGLNDAERLALVESYVRGAITRAIEEAGRATYVVQSGHVSLDVSINAKGDYQYGAKTVMPIDGLEPEKAGEARERAQAELERAEAFLRAKYGRTP